MYPPPEVNNTFNAVLCRLSTKPSPIQGKGSFVAKGMISKHEVPGYYEGVVTTEEGPYVMELTIGGRKVWIDADPKIIGYESIFGTMNEDLLGGIPNVEVLPNGLFRALRDIREGEELVIRYWDKYNWDFLKEKSLNRIHEDWTTIKRRRDHIS